MRYHDMRDTQKTARQKEEYPDRPFHSFEPSKPGDLQALCV